MVVDVHRTVGQTLDRLLENARRLTHLFHAHEEAIVDVAVRADRDVEVVRLVVEIRKILADVERNAGRANHRTGQPVVDRFFRRHHAESDGAAHPDAVARDDAIDLVDAPSGSVLTNAISFGTKSSGMSARHAADARQRRRQPRADPRLEHLVDRSRAAGTPRGTA